MAHTFDAANLDRLNIDGPLHSQTGVLFETLQAFSWSAIAVVIVSKSPENRRSDRGHRRVERKDEVHGTLHRMLDVAR